MRNPKFFSNGFYLLTIFLLYAASTVDAEQAETTESSRNEFSLGIKNYVTIREIEEFTRGILVSQRQIRSNYRIAREKVLSSEASRVAASRVIRSAQAQINEAILAARVASEHNKKLENVERFIGYVGAAYSFYQGISSLDYQNGPEPMSGEKFNDFLFDHYAEDFSNKKSGSDETYELSDEDGGSVRDGVVEGSVNSQPISTAVFEATNLEMTMPTDISSRGELFGYLLEDFRWLKKHPQPDWSAEPSFELTEGEIRLERSFRSLEFIQNLGPTIVDNYVSDNQWTMEDALTTILEGGVDALFTGSVNAAVAVQILLSPTVTSDGTNMSTQLANHIRVELLEIAPNYWTWRTRKPMFGISDLGTMNFEEIQRRLECASGCIGPR